MHAFTRLTGEKCGIDLGSGQLPWWQACAVERGGEETARALSGERPDSDVSAIVLIVGVSFFEIGFGKYTCSILFSVLATVPTRVFTHNAPLSLSASSLSCMCVCVCQRQDAAHRSGGCSRRQNETDRGRGSRGMSKQCTLLPLHKNDCCIVCFFLNVSGYIYTHIHYLRE